MPRSWQSCWRLSVLGPDEFHDAYPDSNEPGLRNNAYTNVMAVWVLRRALDVVDLLFEMRRAELTSGLDFSLEEIARWDEISRKMFVPFQEEGIISHFEGYEKLLEFDWASYRARYTATSSGSILSSKPRTTARIVTSSRNRPTS